jgi:hypothetical protein
MSQNKLEKYLKSSHHNYYGLRFIGYDNKLGAIILYSQLERQFFLFPDELIEELVHIKNMEELSHRIKEFVYRTDYAEMAVDYISKLIKESTE